MNKNIYYQNIISFTFKTYFGETLLASGQGHTYKKLLLAIMPESKRIFFDAVCNKMRLKLEMKNNFVTNCRDHPVSGRMARAFNRYGATQAVAFHISTAFDMV